MNLRLRCMEKTSADGLIRKFFPKFWNPGAIANMGRRKQSRQKKPASEVKAEEPVTTKIVKPVARATATSRQPTGVQPARAERTSAEVMGVVISKPDKELWPDGGDGRPVTKLDLARHFEAGGEWVIPHIKGRPCSVLRAPDGIKGETFFQRTAMPGKSDLLSLTQ